MKNFRDAVVNYVAQTDQHSIAKRNVQVHAPLVQELSPPLLWNWATPAIGQAIFDQLAFCDAMPQSANGQYYAASAKSVAVSYSSFLNLINQQAFPLRQELNQSIDNNTIPGTAAKGWVQSSNPSGQLEWRRAWNVSQTPAEWLAGFTKGQPKNPVEWTFNDPLLNVSLGNSTVLQLGAATQVKLHAEAVGRIVVNPGSWYDSSIITVAQSNKYYLQVPPDVLFGDNGLLNCRVAEFIVALKPSPSIIVDKPLINQDPVTAINTAGFSFTNQMTAATNHTSTQVDLSSSDLANGQVKLSGTNNGADSDNIFIVAVILETYAMTTQNCFT